MEKHYLVIYSKDGSIHLWPANSRQECIKKANDMYSKEKVRELIEATTIIRRDIEENKKLFGCPKSLNIMDGGKIHDYLSR